MSLSSCPYCWEDICACGYKYKDWSIKDIKELIEVLQKVLENKEKEFWKNGNNN